MSVRKTTTTSPRLKPGAFATDGAWAKAQAAKHTAAIATASERLNEAFATVKADVTRTDARSKAGDHMLRVLVETELLLRQTRFRDFDGLKMRIADAIKDATRVGFHV